MGWSVDYLAVKTHPIATNESPINSDINEIKIVTQRLMRDATRLGGIRFGSTFLKWLASFAAIYLLMLEQTNWRTNMLTSLLFPYIFCSLPWAVFNLVRREVGRWIACRGIKALFPKTFPRY